MRAPVHAQRDGAVAAGRAPCDTGPVYSLMIHGGAGALSHLSAEERDAYLASLRRITGVGGSLLATGAPALDVVEQCVRQLEDDPLFNAGCGSVLNEVGEVEMDAAIMDGATLRAGSVAAVRLVRNPISLARQVMERTQHVMLMGAGAQEFARVVGAPTEDAAYFLTEKRRRQWEEAKAAGSVVLDLDTVEQPKKLGTVGAVARDAAGNLAAATSTGGIVNKQFGRVGDSPIVGAGVYADRGCAVSCTGYGEQFIRVAVAKTVADLVELRGLDAQGAATEAIRLLVEKVRGIGGVIVVDAAGSCADAFSSGGMIRARVREGAEVQASLD